MRILAFSKLKEAKHMNMETDTGTEDPFERILAFCKLEEAKHMDMETTRWLSVQACSIHLHCRYLKKMLEAGKRNGLGLEGDDLEELKLVQKKISELGIAFKLCFIIIIQIFRILISVVSILPQVLSERGHFSHLGEGRRSCRSPSRSCLHSRAACFWGVEGASMTKTSETYYNLSR